ncbi:hypothetical protein, partial [Luteirhabdus pelagi]|uniref:hypothetical protein n=1 Tax=Luteirhabdus pelagi TaxID=2792783 RepID=UPI001F36DE6F
DRCTQFLSKTINILIGLLIFVSCQTKQKAEKEKPISEFDLIADLTNFKQKMTELDTLTISFDHSVCIYQGYERIEITKQSDSIRIISNFKKLTFKENPNWERIYDRKISENDTIWNFEQFLKRNERRKNADQNKREILMLTNKKDTIRYSTDGLVDLNRFLTDYYDTMRKIYPENKNGIYGVDIVEE